MTERIRYWKLEPDGRTVKPVDREEWADWFDEANRVLFQTMVGNRQVSTVFLGLDHSFFENGPPLLWETMVFGGDDRDEEYAMRYTTYDQALAGHTQTVIELRERYDGESK